MNNEDNDHMGFRKHLEQFSNWPVALWSLVIDRFDQTTRVCVYPMYYQSKPHTQPENSPMAKLFSHGDKQVRVVAREADRKSAFEFITYRQERKNSLCHCVDKRA